MYAHRAKFTYVACHLEEMLERKLPCVCHVRHQHWREDYKAVAVVVRAVDADRPAGLDGCEITGRCLR